jgi:hypothetical protein
MEKIKQFFQNLQRRRGELKKGQSFVELALILPILLVMLLGMVEVAVFIGRYLDVLDLTREAARFASVRNPFDTSGNTDLDCDTPNLFDFYWDTSCILSPSHDSPVCSTVGEPTYNPTFCNGMNPYVYLNPATDDVVISVYTIANYRNTAPTNHTTRVTDAWPQDAVTHLPVVWAFSDHDIDTVNNANWTKDCDGNVVRSEPHYTTARVNASLSQTAYPSKGYVAVEFFYCHAQILNLPIMSDYLPNPIQIHAYTIMPLPAAAPTPTPIP